MPQIAIEEFRTTLTSLVNEGSPVFTKTIQELLLAPTSGSITAETAVEILAGRWILARLGICAPEIMAPAKDESIKTRRLFVR